jgi:hypothetical protein
MLQDHQMVNVLVTLLGMGAITALSGQVLALLNEKMIDQPDQMITTVLNALHIHLEMSLDDASAVRNMQVLTAPIIVVSATLDEK